MATISSTGPAKLHHLQTPARDSFVPSQQSPTPTQECGSQRRSEAAKSQSFQASPPLRERGCSPEHNLEDRLELSAARAEEIEASLGERVANEVLVKLPQGTSSEEIQNFAQEYGASVDRVFRVPDSMKAEFGGELVLLHLPETLTESRALAAMELDQRVMLAATNDQMRLTATPNDLHPEQWNLKNSGRFGVAGADIDAERAWDITTGDRENGPIIAVIDSGIDTGHLDIRPNLWRNPHEIPNGIDDDRNGVIDDLHGADPKKDNGNLVDHLGHGTHVAGIIGAAGNNDRGVTGVMWQSRLMGLKVADGLGRVSMSAAIFSMLYAAEMGATIANNSWGGPIDNPILKEIMAASPMLHVCAAGNGQSDNDERPFYPASYDLDNVISVGASTKRDVPLYFSNWGKNSVDVHAPGALVYSTLPTNNYDHESGTSMAAPHVAGAAGLVATAYPEATPLEIKNRLIYSSEPLEDLHGKTVSGGRLNAFQALAQDEVPPGAVANLTFDAVNADGFDLSWVTPGDDGNEGQLAHLEAFAYIDGQKERLVPNRPGQAGAEESLSFRLTPIFEERDLKLTMRAIDKVGNASKEVELNAVMPRATSVFFDDAESDVAWETETWGKVPEEGRGMVWTDTPDGDYEDSREYDMVSPSMDLTGVRSATVNFDARMATEKWDFLWIEASSDGGEEYEHLGIIRGDAPREWANYTFDMSRFDNQPEVKLRLRFRTSNANPDDGVYLDNIRILGAKPGQQQPPEEGI